MAASLEMEDDTVRLVTFLDEAEKRVESFRSQAHYLVQERASLLMILQQLKEESLKCSMSEGDRQQFFANMERLKKRCHSVQVDVSTVRNDSQQRALDKLNDILEEMSCQMEAEPEKGRRLLEMYYNACLTETQGAIDARFQNLVLECTVDDQKELRRRLSCRLMRSKNNFSNGT